MGRKRLNHVPRSKNGCSGLIHLTNRDSFEEYLSRIGKNKVPYFNGRRVARRLIVSDILNRITDYWINSKAGVFIKDLGYFYVNRSPFAEPIPTRRRPTNKTNGFRLTFIPTKNSPLHDYNIDYTLFPKLLRTVKNKFKGEVGYLNLMTSVLSYDEILAGYNRDKNNVYKNWVKDNGL